MRQVAGVEGVIGGVIGVRVLRNMLARHGSGMTRARERRLSGGQDRTGQDRTGQERDRQACLSQLLHESRLP